MTPIIAATLPLRTTHRRLVILVALAALLVGPSGALVSRTMLFAAGWFIVVVANVPRQRLVHVLVVADAGAAVGLMAAVGLTAVPILLVMIASSDDLLFYGWRGRPASTPPPTLLVAFLSLLCLVIANARINARHRRTSASPPAIA